MVTGNVQDMKDRLLAARKTAKEAHDGCAGKAQGVFDAAETAALAIRTAADEGAREIHVETTGNLKVSVQHWLAAFSTEAWSK